MGIQPVIPIQGDWKTGALWPSISASLVPITEGEALGIFTGG